MKKEFYMGCTAAKPSGATDNVNVDLNALVSDAVISCRKHCHSENYSLALLQNNKMCSCYDAKFDTSFLTGNS